MTTAADSERASPGVRAQSAATYVYGIVDSSAQLPDVTGIGDAPLALVPLDGVAAVVSDLAGRRSLGNRADLRCHESVLESLVASGLAVLPMRFGAVVSTRELVAAELLADHSDLLHDALDRVRGRAEFVLSGRYEDAVLREIVEEDLRIRAMREMGGGYSEMVRLGEAVVAALERKRANDARRLLDRVAGCAVAVQHRGTPEPDEVIDAALLVESGREQELLDRAEQLAGDCAGRIRLRLLGPVAPYDFVPVAG